MLTIELLVDFAPVFLPENTRSLCFPEKTSPKHPATFSRKARYNACGIILFVRPSSDVDLAITAAVDPCFVTPQYSFPLFLGPVWMFICPG